ncbi:MAG: hypothetical protein ACOCWQ_03550 [Nanoarchaeota archaeon]
MITAESDHFLIGFAKSLYPQSALEHVVPLFAGGAEIEIHNDVTYPYYTVKLIPVESALAEIEGSDPGRHLCYLFVNHALAAAREYSMQDG